MPRCTDGEPLRQLARGGQPGGGEQPGDLVEDAELLGDGAAVGVGVDQHRAQPPPGQLGGEADGHGGAPGRAGRAPDRDHPPAGRRRRRPAARSAPVGAGASGASGWRRLVGRGHGVGQRVEVRRRRATGRPIRDAAQPRRPSAAAPAGTTATGRTSWRRRWSMAARSRPGRVEAEHRDVGLAGAGRGQQVVDVDAALEHHDRPGASPSSRSAARLPRRAGGDDRTTTTAQPRRTTVSDGALGGAEQREEPRGVAARSTASTSWRLPVGGEALVERRARPRR